MIAMRVQAKAADFSAVFFFGEGENDSARKAFDYGMVMI